MIRGAQRQMIVVKTAENRIFEEAYFVIRPGAKTRGEDMVSEANKIIEACTDKKSGRQGAKGRKWLIAAVTFFSGTAFGALLVGLIHVLV